MGQESPDKEEKKNNPFLDELEEGGNKKGKYPFVQKVPSILVFAVQENKGVLAL